jgi:C-5 cytosine-specific DNA methylase
MLDSRPLAIDLFTGLHGWAEGLIAEGFRVIGVDIVDMSAEIGEPKPDHFELVLQDVLTLHGAQFKDAALIVASPPCQEFSYMAMPWRRAKQIARALRGQDEFPEGYTGSRTLAELTALFDACFRIQREASEAAGRHIPLVVENVKGAQPWVGRARWSFGSYYLWGDVPALMPLRIGGFKSQGMNWSDQTKRGQDFTRLAGQFAEGQKNPGFRFDGSGRSFQSESVARHVEGQKAPGGAHRLDGAPHTARLTNPDEGRKFSIAGPGGVTVATRDPVAARSGQARKAASAKIAKIPFALSQWIARAHLPQPALEL